MKKMLFFILVAFASVQIHAQVDLPRPSPKAKIMQRIGLTDVEVVYYRPSKSNRQVFGKLVPFGEVWRTGANDATSLNFSTDVTIDGKLIKAGEYALFTIPNKDNWTIIINSNEGQKGSTNYKQNLDVLRLTAKTEMINEPVERFTIQLDPISDKELHLILSWENTRVRFPIMVDYMALAQKNIDGMLRNLNGMWYQLTNAADFLLNNNGNLDEALKLADRAVNMHDHFFPRWVKAQILAKQGKNKEASMAAKEAKESGERNPSSWYDGNKDAIVKAMNDWNKGAKK